ncbi:hypothetical protein BC834DRAFT_629299 [Gloeopeniophorella convolvens]|nr:hypothetical protein BC834DRAFT_629299 [Gloeopeniophorella convolvens]
MRVSAGARGCPPRLRGAPSYTAPRPPARPQCGRMGVEGARAGWDHRVRVSAATVRARRAARSPGNACACQVCKVCSDATRQVEICHLFCTAGAGFDARAWARPQVRVPTAVRRLGRETFRWQTPRRNLRMRTHMQMHCIMMRLARRRGYIASFRPAAGTCARGGA